MRIASALSIAVVGFLAAVAVAKPLDVQGGTIDYHFVGSGFHQQLQLDVSLASLTEASNSGRRTVAIDIDLPRAYFVDIAEAKQAHVFTGSSQPNLVSMSSEFIFDIEAPIFKIPYTTNKVTTVVELPQLPSGLSNFSLLFPIHTRYEEVDVERTFDWAEFLDHIPSYTTRCIEAHHVSGTVTNHGPLGSLSLVPATKSACVDFPRGILGQLPAVYWLTMGLLTSGAILVIACVR
jgi:hypothetical protein